MYKVNVWDDGLKEEDYFDHCWEKIDDNGRGKITLKNKSNQIITISEWKCSFKTLKNT